MGDCASSRSLFISGISITQQGALEAVKECFNMVVLPRRGIMKNYFVLIAIHRPKIKSGENSCRIVIVAHGELRFGSRLTEKKAADNLVEANELVARWRKENAKRHNLMPYIEACYIGEIYEQGGE